MPTTSADSPRMQQLGYEQRAVLNEEEASRQAEAQKQVAHAYIGGLRAFCEGFETSLKRGNGAT